MEKDDIIQAEERLRSAMETSDITALNTLIADDLLFTTHTGLKLSKADDLHLHQSGILKFDDITIHEHTIKIIHPHIALVSADVEIKATFNQQPANGNFMFTRVWEEIDGRLQVICGHVCEKA